MVGPHVVDGRSLQSWRFPLRWRWEMGWCVGWNKWGKSENEPRQTSWLVFCDAFPPLDSVVGLPMSYHHSYMVTLASYSPRRRWFYIEGLSVGWKA